MTAPLADARFRLLVKVSLGWNFAVGIAAPFFAAHMLTNLKMTFTQISIYTVLVSIVAILLNKPWGALIDRFGCKSVMLVCAFGIAIVPFVWFFPRADFLWILGLEAIYSAILWTGFNLALFNIPIASSPKDGRTLYLAVFSVVSGVGFFVASLLGGMLAESWSDIHWMIGGQQIINYHLLFGLSGVLRLLAAFMFASLRESHATRFPIMMQFMGYSFLKWFSLGRQIFPRAVRRDQPDDDNNDSD
jgi:MFS family permease